MTHGKQSRNSLPTADIGEGKSVPFVAPPLCVPETNDTFKHTRELNPSQKEALETLRSHIFGDSSLQEHHRSFCTDACLLRYLRARDFHIKHAEALLRSTLKWREEYKPHEISPYGNMDKEAETGKIFVAGNDLTGRPILYMRPRFQNTNDFEEQNRLTIYMLERAIQCMDSTKGIETIALLIDYKDYSLRNAPPISQSKHFLQVFSDHYPERLGVAYFIDAPTVFHLSFKLLQPLIPHETKKKMHFVSGQPTPGHHKHKALSKTFNMALMPREYAGETNLQYDHAEYWANEKAVWDARMAAPTAASTMDTAQ